jgi:hypothetical protein
MYSIVYIVISRIINAILYFKYLNCESYYLLQLTRSSNTHEKIYTPTATDTMMIKPIVMHERVTRDIPNNQRYQHHLLSCSPFNGRLQGR